MSFLLMTTLARQAWAQDRQLTGKVTAGADGSPLPGVNVAVKGTMRGTTTNAEGTYRISVSNGSTLVFTAVGFARQEIAVGSQTTLNVILQEDAAQLTEVVITSFGIQRTERELGTSVAKLKGSELVQAAPVNLANGYTGKVSGLQVSTTNNGVNATPRITLRGARSFLGNNQALLVVNGIITDIAFLNAINPNDIENSTILKGPSAAALYGSDASNGVIILNTKRGTSNGQPQISYSNNTQLESVSYMPGLQRNFGSNGGEGAPFLDANGQRLYVPFENQSFGPRYDGSLQPLGYGVQVRQPDGTFRIDTLKVPYASTGTDPRRAFFNTGVTSQHDISYRVGDGGDYFGLSLQRVDQKGIVPNDKFQRTTLTLNGGRQVGKFRANAYSTFAYSNQNVAGGDFFQGRPVYWNVLNTPAHVPLTRFKDITDPFSDVNGYYNAYYPNPYWQVTGDNSRQITNTYNLQGSGDIAYQFTKWLNVLYRVGGQVKTTSYKANTAAVSFTDYAISDPWGAGNLASSVRQKNATVADQTQLQTRFTGDLLVTINPKFGDFSTQLILGNHTQQDYYRSMFGSAAALQIPGTYNISNRIGNPNISEGITRSRLVGVFGDLTVGYKDFLFLNVTARNDWTSLLSKQNRSFFYPGVNASFILTDAFPSLKTDWLNSVKLRGGIAQVGNITVGAYQLQNVFNPGGGFPFGGQAGYSLSNVQLDPNLKPEFTTNREVGLEVNFLRRFNLEAVYYKSNTINQTVPIQVSRATGYTSALINSGEMANQGIELDLQIAPIVKVADFSWRASVNYTYLTSKVVSLFGDIPRLNIPYNSGAGSDVYAAVGQNYPALYVSDVQRVSADPASTYYDKSGQFVGRPVVDPTTGYPILDANLRYAGTTQPKHRLGISNTFAWKGLSLTALFEYRGGAVIYNAIGNALEFTGIGVRSAYNGRQNFIYPNSVLKNPDGTFSPNTNVSTRDGNLEFWTNSAFHNAGYSYVTSADFWKLRELVLNYNVPATWLNYTKFVKSLGVALTGRNLLMWRPKTNVFTDPEFSGDNSNATGTTTEFQTPPTRIYGIRVNVGF